MPFYRLYIMDRSGHIGRCAELEARDDESAISEAGLHGGEGAMELWHLARLVRRFDEPDDAQAAE